MLLMPNREVEAALPSVSRGHSGSAGSDPRGIVNEVAANLPIYFPILRVRLTPGGTAEPR